MRARVICNITMLNNLKYLLLVRFIAMGGQVLALLFLQRVFAIDLPAAPALWVIVALALFTLASWLRLRARAELSDWVFLGQLLVDVVALTLLVYFTGGSANPFIFLFILPVIFAAASIRPALAALIALAAACGYTLLMFFHVPVAEQAMGQHGAQLHVWGMWYGFILSAGLVTFFVSRIAAALRQRDRALAAAREEALRAEQVVTLGALAAGTAHELGTPLSTMAVLAQALQEQYADQPRLHKDLELMREQLGRCKTILAEMASDAGQLQADSGYIVSVEEFLLDLFAQWQQARGDIPVDIDCQGQQPAPLIIADKSLRQAITNILNNAADASRAHIQLTGNWTAERLTIGVIDDGQGIPEAYQAELGNRILESTSSGQGIGLFLAQTTLKRLGGGLAFTNLPGGGLRTRIELPLQRLLARNAG